MAYLGNTPTTQSFISGTDYFNGDGSTVAFTLTRTVNSVNDIEVVINNVEQQPNTAYTISGTTITFTSAPSSGTSNIYVRYLSTTTQSITPSQNTVSYSTLNSDNQSKLGISFKNRLINGNMVIDQRNAGASVTIGSGSYYTLDRWSAASSQASKYSIQQNAGSVTPPAGFVNYLGVTSLSSYSLAAGDYFLVQQLIEGYNVADLMWGTTNAKTVTLSFWVYSSLTGTFGGGIRINSTGSTYPFTYTISAANTWQQISITIPGPSSTYGVPYTTNSSGLQVIWGFGVGTTYSGTAGTWSTSTYFSATGATSVVGTSGATFYVTGTQFEVGTQATTFDYRSYGTELSLCQRYYLQSGGGAYAQIFGALGVCYTTTNAVLYFPLPVSMRASPTLTYTGTPRLNNGQSGFVISAMTGTIIADNLATAQLGVTSSGLTLYQAIRIDADAAGSIVKLSAEL